MQLRFNGTAPAWPHLLGTTHPFYPVDDPAAMGSASYSILEKGNGSGWEILIDAGHNTVPFLLQNRNRIPDVVVLTHGHPDHILGLDWVVQSVRFKDSGKKLPVYCTQGVYENLMHTYGHCREHIEHRVLQYGETITIPETPGVELTPYPVFHGQGAKGASALYFKNLEYKQQSVLLTGDLLCPLFRRKDVEQLQKASYLVVDTNNLLPVPTSNHMSLLPKWNGDKMLSPLLQQWYESVMLEDYLKPHSVDESNTFFNELKADYREAQALPHTIIDLLKILPIPEVHLVHYFGKYDEIHYNQELLNREELAVLATDVARAEKLRTRFRVPWVGSVINF